MRFVEARNRGSESWYLSTKTWRGSVKWACKEQLLSSRGGALPLTLNSRLGCSPVGKTNFDEKMFEEGWCRDGKENSVGEGLVFSPITVKNPARLISSVSKACSWLRIPTSSREGEGVFGFEIERGEVVEGKKAESVKAWEIVSKDMSRLAASERDETRDWHDESDVGHSLWET